MLLSMLDSSEAGSKNSFVHVVHQEWIVGRRYSNFAMLRLLSTAIVSLLLPLRTTAAVPVWRLRECLCVKWRKVLVYQST